MKFLNFGALTLLCLSFTPAHSNSDILKPSRRGFFANAARAAAAAVLPRPTPLLEAPIAVPAALPSALPVVPSPRELELESLVKDLLSRRGAEINDTLNRKNEGLFDLSHFFSSPSHFAHMIRMPHNADVLRMWITHYPKVKSISESDLQTARELSAMIDEWNSGPIRADVIWEFLENPKDFKIETLSVGELDYILRFVRDGHSGRLQTDELRTKMMELADWEKRQIDKLNRLVDPIGRLVTDGTFKTLQWSIVFQDEINAMEREMSVRINQPLTVVQALTNEMITIFKFSVKDRINHDEYLIALGKILKLFNAFSFFDRDVANLFFTHLNKFSPLMSSRLHHSLFSNAEFDIASLSYFRFTKHGRADSLAMQNRGILSHLNARYNLSSYAFEMHRISPVNGERITTARHLYFYQIEDHPTDPPTNRKVDINREAYLAPERIERLAKEYARLIARLDRDIKNLQKFPEFAGPAIEIWQQALAQARVELATLPQRVAADFELASRLDPLNQSLEFDKQETISSNLPVSLADSSPKRFAQFEPPESPKWFARTLEVDATRIVNWMNTIKQLNVDLGETVMARLNGECATDGPSVPCLTMEGDAIPAVTQSQQCEEVFATNH